MMYPCLYSVVVFGSGTYNTTKKYNRTRLLQSCLQCFDTVGWAPGRASGLQKLRSDEDLEWLAVCSEVFAYGPADATASQKPVIS